ncbi:MAG: hypothetical protein FWG79_04605 [Bacteroidales bacterium]|nr:hypothetical protein [Bacteroidales bacterium]
MKKITLIVLLALSWQVSARTFETSDFKRNELKIDVAWLIFEPAMKVEYERFLNKSSSFGAVGFLGFSSADDNLFEQQLLGTYRLYFGKNPMQGFFFEGHLGVTSGVYQHRLSDGFWSETEDRSYTAFGFGIALGWKWCIPKQGIVFDLFYGGGRLIHNDAGFYPRFGFCLGKRF